MVNIIKIINQLQNTPGTNDKLNILKENKDNELLKRVLNYTYNPYKKYKITEKTLNDIESYKSCAILDIFELLDKLASNNINDLLRDETKSFLKYYQETNVEIFELYKMIILKDLKINIGVKSINKVWKNLIPEFNIMLANKYFEMPHKVEGKEFIITQKLDGYRLVAINNNDNIEFYTRQGQLVEGLIDIEKEVKQFLPNNMVLDGELLAINNMNLNSKDLYRETIKRGRKKGDKTGLEYHVFDLITLDDLQNGVSNNKCSNRKEILHTMILGSYSKFVKEVPILYKGKEINRITKLLDEQVDMGNEGVMVNISDAPYECKRSSQILKVKKFQDCDVKVLNIIEGTGKNKNKLGAITIQFEHDNELYTCDCGSGFSDEERLLYWENPELLMNKIVTIGYFEVSQNSKTKEYGLRFPTWKGIIRTDKTEISMY